MKPLNWPKDVPWLTGKDCRCKYIDVWKWEVFGQLTIKRDVVDYIVEAAGYLLYGKPYWELTRARHARIWNFAMEMLGYTEDC